MQESPLIWVFIWIPTALYCLGNKFMCYWQVTTGKSRRVGLCSEGFSIVLQSLQVRWLWFLEEYKSYFLIMLRQGQHFSTIKEPLASSRSWGLRTDHWTEKLNKGWENQSWLFSRAVWLLILEWILLSGFGFPLLKGNGDIDDVHMDYSAVKIFAGWLG